MKYYKQDLPNHKTGYLKVNTATMELWHLQVNDETGTEFFYHKPYINTNDEFGNRVLTYRYMHITPTPGSLNHSSTFHSETYHILLAHWQKSDEVTFAIAAGAL